MQVEVAYWETFVGWPNGLASFLASTGKLPSISLANNRLVDVIQLATWFGWPNGEKLALTSVQIWSQPKWAQVDAIRRKSTQVHPRPGQTESQVDLSFQLATPFGQGLRVTMVLKHIGEYLESRQSKLKQNLKQNSLANYLNKLLFNGLRTNTKYFEHSFKSPKWILIERMFFRKLSRTCFTTQSCLYMYCVSFWKTPILLQNKSNKNWQ